MSASFRVGKGGRVTVDPAEIGGAEVNVSNGLSSADFDLPEGVDMSVSARDGDGATDIEYINEDGEAIGAYQLEYETEDGNVVDIVADFDEQSGEFDVTEEAAEAEDVDPALLKALEDDLVDEGETASGNDSGNAADDEGTGQDSAGDSGDSGTDGSADSGADNNSSEGDNAGGANDSAGSGSTNDEPIAEDEPAPEPDSGEAE